MRNVGAWLFPLLLMATPAAADDFDFGEEDEQEAGWSLPLRGTLGLGAGYQVGSNPMNLVSLDLVSTFVVDWSGNWGRLSGEGDIELNTAHWIEGRESTAKEYAVVAIPRALSYSYAFEHLSVEVGQFMTVWSAGDLIPVLDILTAADTAEGFFARPEQYRMGQVGAKVDAYWGSHTFSVVWHGWPQMNRVVDGAHPYSMSMGKEIPGEFVWDPSEVAARWSMETSGGNVGLMGGQVYDRNPILQIDYMVGDIIGVDYLKYPFVGAAATQTFGAVLLKTEFSWSWGAPLLTFEQSSSMQPRDTLKALVGLDYNHESLGTWMIESTLLHVIEEPFIDPMTQEQFTSLADTAFQLAVMWSNQFLNESLTVMAMGILMNGVDNRVIRAGVDYKVLDDLVLSAQGTIIDFADSDIIDDWDRVDLYLKWGWDLAR